VPTQFFQGARRDQVPNRETCTVTARLHLYSISISICIVRYYYFGWPSDLIVAFHCPRRACIGAQQPRWNNLVAEIAGGAGGLPPSDGHGGYNSAAGRRRVGRGQRARGRKTTGTTVGLAAPGGALGMAGSTRGSGSGAQGRFYLFRWSNESQSIIGIWVRFPNISSLREKEHIWWKL
jgi:hypothetical protein